MLQPYPLFSRQRHLQSTHRCDCSTSPDSHGVEVAYGQETENILDRHLSSRDFVRMFLLVRENRARSC